MHFIHVLFALMLPSYFGSTLALSSNSDADNVVQAQLNHLAHSGAASRVPSAGDKVLNAVKAIIDLYDSASQTSPTADHNAVSHQNVSIRMDTLSPIQAQDSNSSSGSDIDKITSSCKGPGYCCCPTGCSSGCPRTLLPAFPGLVQELSATDIDVVELTCKGNGYCCCKTGCGSSGCPRAMMVLFPDILEQELTSVVDGKSEL